MLYRHEVPGDDITQMRLFDNVLAYSKPWPQSSLFIQALVYFTPSGLSEIQYLAKLMSTRKYFLGEVSATPDCPETYRSHVSL
jgi:hypothetical protein